MGREKLCPKDFEKCSIQLEEDNGFSSRTNLVPYKDDFLRDADAQQPVSAVLNVVGSFSGFGNLVFYSSGILTGYDAAGTPLAWTNNVSSAPEYHSILIRGF